MEPSLDPRLHFVVATAIIAKPRDEKTSLAESGRAYEFLIAKRAAHEKAHPSRWTVPGGKLVLSEYEHLPKTAPNYPQWYNVVEWVLRKETQEEVGIEIEKPRYLTDLVFVRPDGYPVLTISYWCLYKSGEVKLCKDLTDYAWVTPEEAKKYDLIEGIAEEIEDTDRLLKSEA